MSYQGNIIYEKYVIHALLTNMPRILKIIITLSGIVAHFAG